MEESRDVCRYSLTLNSKNKGDLDEALKHLRATQVIPKFLRLDECFGPCKTDGSFITLLSSDTLKNSFIDKEDGDIINWTLTKIADAMPKSKFTLNKEDEAGVKWITRWNFEKFKLEPCEIEAANG